MTTPAESEAPATRRRECPTKDTASLAVPGIAVMLAGTVIEAIADRQKTVYQQRDDDKPDVLDTGLWALSRHPNYFGDSVVWDGARLAATASAPGALTFPAPAVMSYLLIFATGAKRTERRVQQRPDSTTTPLSMNSGARSQFR